MNFECQTVFSPKFGKQEEEYKVLDEIDLYINLNVFRNLTESDIDSSVIRSQSEHQNQNQESKDAGWSFDKKYFND